MSAFSLFATGFGASLVVEIARMLHIYEQRGRLPQRYYDPVFWGLRLAVALCAGALPIAYGAETMLQAAGLGAGAPSLLLALGKGIKNQEDRAALKRRS